MENKALVLLITLFFFLMAGCAGITSRTQSNTLDDNAVLYPPSRYLTATGTGRTESEAGRQARAELSNIFESKVSNDTYSTAKSVIDSSEGETFTKRVESTIRIKSDVQLKGVQIVKTWKNKENNIYHALAALDKFQARKNWNSEIENIDTMMDAELNMLNATQSILLRMISLKKIVNLWNKKALLSSRLSIIGFSDESFSDVDIKSIFSMMSEIRAAMRVYIWMTGEQGSEIKSKLAETLSADGFILSDSKFDADALILGYIETEPLQIDNPDVSFVRATALVSIIDSVSGAQVGEINENIRKAHQNPKEAAHKAVQNISEIVSERLTQFFHCNN